MKFIIVTLEYNDDCGGCVVLHQLCDKLNQLGHHAFIWPLLKPVFNITNPLKTLYLFLKYFYRLFQQGFNVNKNLVTPFASYSDLKDAIVIYPEIVVGNPLNANKVVRWLLHKPGFNTNGKINFGDKDLFFYYDKAFDDPRFNHNGENHLCIISDRAEIYKQINNNKRNGSCYILRKGFNRELIHDTSISLLIDNLSHQEIAKIFNETEYCISYDMYTMYTTYAALCGCIPIVVPEKGISKEQWNPSIENHYGIAYGFDDIDYAKQTHSLLLNAFEEKVQTSNLSVSHFIEKCAIYFENISA